MFLPDDFNLWRWDWKSSAAKKDLNKNQNHLNLCKGNNVLKYWKASDLVACILQANHIFVNKFTTVLACLIFC